MRKQIADQVEAFAGRLSRAEFRWPGSALAASGAHANEDSPCLNQSQEMDNGLRGNATRRRECGNKYPGRRAVGWGGPQPEVRQGLPCLPCPAQTGRSPRARKEAAGAGGVEQEIGINRRERAEARSARAVASRVDSGPRIRKARARSCDEVLHVIDKLACFAEAAAPVLSSGNQCRKGLFGGIRHIRGVRR